MKKYEGNMKKFEGNMKEKNKSFYFMNVVFFFSKDRSIWYQRGKKCQQVKLSFAKYLTFGFPIILKI